MSHFLSVTDGKFELRRRGGRKIVCATAAADELFQYLDQNGVTSFSNSSSVDFPEEYGMPFATVRRLDELIEARQQENERRRDRMLTPRVFRVQVLSVERPMDPEFFASKAAYKRAMRAYRQQQPCDGAVWKRKHQWWQLQLDSLTCLVEFQKASRHSVTLDQGVLTINDLPLQHAGPEGCC